MRYTNNQLSADLELLNEKLERLYQLNSDFYPDKAALLYFVVGQRNGYSAVDLATKEDIERHCTFRNLECGTPRECLDAAQTWLIQNHI